MKGNLVVFDLGDHTKKIGLLHKVENSSVELIIANGEKVIWNVQHLKTVYTP
ncbi:hypothetical protein D3C85_1744410 [compost metagenome]